jgi:hypothetical protein
MIKSQLGLYTDTLCLIKGRDVEYVPDTDKLSGSIDFSNIINKIIEDYIPVVIEP